METLNQVDIDSLGRFKYVMIKVLDPDTQNTRIIVRGFQFANYHVELLENFERILNQHRMNNLVFSCLGGGRIYHNPDKRVIKIYGTSEAYGKADHEEAARLIKLSYPNYEVTWSDEESFYEPGI